MPTNNQFIPHVQNLITVPDPTVLQFLPTIVLNDRFPFNIPSLPIPENNKFFNVQTIEDGGWYLCPMPEQITHEMWSHLIDATNSHNSTCSQVNMLYKAHIALIQQRDHINHLLNMNHSNASELIKSHIQEKLLENIIEMAEAKFVNIENNVLSMAKEVELKNMEVIVLDKVMEAEVRNIEDSPVLPRVKSPTVAPKKQVKFADNINEVN